MHKSPIWRQALLSALPQHLVQECVEIFELRSVSICWDPKLRALLEEASRISSMSFFSSFGWCHTSQALRPRKQARGGVAAGNHEVQSDIAQIIETQFLAAVARFRDKTRHQIGELMQLILLECARQTAKCMRTTTICCRSRMILSQRLRKTRICLRRVSS